MLVLNEIIVYPVIFVFFFSSCPYPYIEIPVLHKNPTDAPHMLTPLYSHHALLHVAALEGRSAGITDMFCEQDLQNNCLDVNIRLKSNVLCVT